jgi:hypothetical protein
MIFLWLGSLSVAEIVDFGQYLISKALSREVNFMPENFPQLEVSNLTVMLKS